MSVTVRAKYEEKVLKPYQDLELNEVEALSIAGLRERLPGCEHLSVLSL
jgi:predicted DNA-binding antitoxin AbrB/MazE fold protein